MSAVLFAFEAGGRRAHHETDGLAMIHTIAGRVDAAIPETTYRLRAGSLLVREPGIVHDAVADVPSRVLLIVGPCHN